MSTALATVNGSQHPTIDAGFAPQFQPAPARTFSLPEIGEMAAAVVESGMFPGIKTEAAAFALMMLCESKGLHPMQAVERYSIIQGRPSMRADAMQAEFQRHGGKIRWVRTTPEECVAEFFHPTQAKEGVEVSFTIADARRAKLADKDTWRSYPASMLRARVISMGVRMVLPGVVMGIYTPEEVQDFDLPPAAPTPAPAPRREARQASAPAEKSSPGSEFVAFLGEESRRIGRDLVKSASSYGQRKQYPANIHDWTEEQASACWGWIERGLAKKADEAAAKQAPAPASTAEAQRDESKAEIEKAYRPGPVRQRFEDWIVEAMEEANAWWREADTRISAGLPDEKLVSSRYHLSNHLGKWAEAVPEFKYTRPDPFLPGPVMDRLAPIWERNRKAFEDEANTYLYADLPAKVVAEAAAKAEKRAAKNKPQAEPGANG